MLKCCAFNYIGWILNALPILKQSRTITLLVQNNNNILGRTWSCWYSAQRSLRVRFDVHFVLYKT